MNAKCQQRHILVNQSGKTLLETAFSDAMVLQTEACSGFPDPVRLFTRHRLNEFAHRIECSRRR